MDFNPTNQQLLRWYVKGYDFLNDTMLLDMIQTQVQNKDRYLELISSTINCFVIFECLCKRWIFRIPIQINILQIVIEIFLLSVNGVLDTKITSMST